MINNNTNKQEENSKEGVFKTADFVLSVFLLYSGVKLLGTEPYPDDHNPRRKRFLFEKTDQVEVLMNHYISLDPTVKLKKIIAVQKQLKRLIYTDTN